MYATVPACKTLTVSHLASRVAVLTEVLRN